MWPTGVDIFFKVGTINSAFSKLHVLRGAPKLPLYRLNVLLKLKKMHIPHIRSNEDVVGLNQNIIASIIYTSWVF